MSQLELVYLDEHLAVINKPSGLLVHRSRIASGAREFAMQMLRNQLGCHVYPVHRLDRPTSGLLIFGLNSDVARTMTEQLTAREVSKTYHAVVRGYVSENGTIDYALKEELDKLADKDADPDKDKQPAVTHYQCLKQIELPYKVSKKHDTTRYSLVQMQPEMGRKHQLRRHMAHIRHPIVGDTNHGDGRHNNFFREHFNCHRLLLAATGLSFKHPVSGESINLEIPLPNEFHQPFLK
ncbi:tRNA pseudouridine(65) synthase TruC [Idiomarina loihiensis]|uniref:tRNA pseudouridine(65) synthase TruC n=1 Tax=Idiomarina loihiensis TaxID=135577 RepID=UPI00130CAE92|nr:tRNA pseudouridine(65) synthase TruC [Idiomarina loihiensis]MRJ43690.1 tRNA pseudouridine(65) synthase TruC [Idiomarina loihiensis]UTW34172.1 tRNA pseudouridine(65) synthase TruC [Idiomarina loihiensis]